ncbi:hypothetical protein D3C78_1503780 [compost metagenome]
MHGLLKGCHPAPLAQAADTVIESAYARQNELGGTVQLVRRADDPSLAAHVLDHVDDRRQVAATVVDH